MKEDIQASLMRMPSNDFKAAAQDLLAVLGYRSARTLGGQTGDVADFIAQFPAPKPNTKTELAFREHVQSVRLVFQVTSDEITAVPKIPAEESIDEIAAALEVPVKVILETICSDRTVKRRDCSYHWADKATQIRPLDIRG